MFDRLIESTSLEAAPTPRRRYFVTSAIVLLVLFVTGVVASLYAADVDLGVDQFDMARVVAPITPETPEPPAPPHTDTPTSIELPIRHDNIARVDEGLLAPTDVSTVPNAGLSRPKNGFLIGKGIESNAVGSLGSDRVGTCNACTGSSDLSDTSETARNSDAESTPPPPPARRPEPPKRTVSIGVVNGNAILLPKPAYPPSALAVGAQGKVDVQVTIDEEGNVVSAKAASGHPLLRQAAERAAWQARFTPTTLSKVPVKVTGVIVYNFTR